MTDNALWEAIREGDEKAFAVLFERYWSGLFTTVFRYTRDREACADIVHDIFLNLWRKRRQLDIRSPGNYMTAAARYHVYRYLKRAGGPLKYTDEWEGLSREVTGNGGEARIRSLELQTIIDGQLQKLPPRCREIYVMSRREHLSNEEIASRLRISKRTVENQITYALRRFRSVLKNSSLLFFLLSGVFLLPGLLALPGFLPLPGLLLLPGLLATMARGLIS